MAYHYKQIMAYHYKQINELCKKNEYNLVLHKHLGDIVYAIAIWKIFEKQYKSKLHFIIRKQHKFLMDIFGIKNYSIYDLDAIIKNNKTFQIDYFKNNIPSAEALDRLENEMFQAIFHCIPVKGEPFVCENPINNFFTYPYFWSYRWSSNMGIEENFKFSIPPYIPKLSNSVVDALDKIAPLEKIVLFAPEAATATEFAPEFWDIIAEKVHNHGYTIIVNSKKYKIKYGISAFELNLSLQDVVALGLKCAYVFSLRSGLCDVLVGAKEKLYTFYPAMLHREINSLNKCFYPNPNVNEIDIYKWKINTTIWEGENLTPLLQKHINLMHRAYWVEKIKKYLTVFSKKQHNAHKWWMNLFNNVAGKSKIFPENNVMNKTEKYSQNINYKFLKLPIYSRILQKKNANEWVLRYKIFGGIVLFKTNYRHLWRLSICGIPLYTHKQSKDKFLFFTVRKINFREKWLKKLTKQIDKKYDDIYLIRHNIGETYIELKYLKERIKKQKSKNPLVIVWNKKFLELYKMYTTPTIDLLYVPLYQADINEVFCEQNGENKDIALNYRGHRFFCSTPHIAENMKKEYRDNPNVNFYTYLLNAYRIGSKSKPSKENISEYLINSVDLKIEQIGLDKKFIILAPEASSLNVLPSNFWQDIINNLSAKGYDIFLNSYNNKDNLLNVKTCNMDIAELLILAQKSSGIISMASGLAVFLTSANVSMDLIYTDFVSKSIDYNADLALKLYSVHNLPNVDKSKVREYNANIIDYDKLINQIIEQY